MAACNTTCKKSNAMAGIDGEMCPNRMQDGRMFTDYNPRCMQNQFAKEMNNLPTNYQYRQHLITNGDKILQENRENAWAQYSCKPCFDFNEDGTMLPEKRMIDCNKETCGFKSESQGGLGMGRTNTGTGSRVSSYKTYPLNGVVSNGDNFQKYGTAL
jgi:hypothetical protein